MLFNKGAQFRHRLICRHSGARYRDDCRQGGWSTGCKPQMRPVYGPCLQLLGQTGQLSRQRRRKDLSPNGGRMEEPRSCLLYTSLFSIIQNYILLLNKFAPTVKQLISRLSLIHIYKVTNIYIVT